MGTTILQCQAKSRDGLLLRESFESPEFLTQQGWTLLSGSPVISNAVAFDGLNSLLLDTSYPRIQKVTGDFKFSAVWFHDDATVVAGGFTPYAIWETSGGQVFALGVDMAVSTVNYTMVINGAASNSGVARTTAWRRFTVNVTGLTAAVAIDGVMVGSAVIATPMNKIRLGPAFGGAPAFGYFDLVQVALTPNVNFKRLTDGQVVKLYKADGTLIGTATAAAGAVSIPVSTIDQPFDGYVTISKPDGNRPQFYGPVLSYSSGDVWGLETFDLGRRVSGFTLERESRRDDKESSSGKDESLFYYARDKVALTISDLTNDQRLALERWWGLAEDGSLFSVAIDSDEVYKSALAADAQASTASVNTASGAGVNIRSKVRLRRSNGLTSEVAQVQSVTGPVLQMTQTLLEGYLTGDEIRHAYFWPQAKGLDKTLKPMLTNPKLKRWSVTINFKESY